MIGVAALLYDIDLKLNKVATSWHQNIPLEDKIIALNEAQIKLVKGKLFSGGPAPTGLDEFKRRYDDLQVLVQPYMRLPLTAASTRGLHRYTTDIGNLEPPYMFYVDCYVPCNKGACSQIPVMCHRVKHGDLQMMLANANTAPSFEYRQAPVTVTDNRLEFYTDGSFTPADAYLSYVRHPERIDMEGYLDFDGAPSVTRDSELGAHLQDELADIAVQLLAMNTENQTAAQYAGLRLQHNP